MFRQLADRLGRCAPEHAHALQIIEFDCRLDVTNKQEVDDFDRTLCGGLERREFGFAIDRPFCRQANQIIKALGLTHGLHDSHTGDALRSHIPRRVRSVKKR